MKKLRITIGILATISMCVYVWIVYVIVMAGRGWTSSASDIPTVIVELCIIILPALAYLVEVAMVIKPLPIEKLSLLSVATHAPLIIWLLMLNVTLLFSLYPVILIPVSISPILFMIYVYRLEEQQKHPTKPA